jgi:soluble P-type ATPase
MLCDVPLIAYRQEQKPWRSIEAEHYTSVMNWRNEMIRIDIPQRGSIELQHAVFDINGTLAIDGSPFPGVIDRLKQLAEALSLHALTAGTHGNLVELERVLGFPLQIIGSGEEKTRYVERLGPENVIAFGNGMNDVGMLRVAAVGVAILSGEGVAIGALQAADVLALGPVDAIDLVLNPKRLVATLRG